MPLEGGDGSAARDAEALIGELWGRVSQGLQRQGKLGHGPGQIPRDAVLAMMVRLNGEELRDVQRAMVELTNSFEIAADVLAPQVGQQDAMEYPFLRDVLLRVAALTAEGRLEDGAQAIDEALEQAQRYGGANPAALWAGLATAALSPSVQRWQKSVLLLAAMRQASLLRDAGRTAKACLARFAVYNPERPAWSEDFAKQMEGMCQDGLDDGMNFPLRVSSAMARHRVDSARTSAERGGALLQVAAPLVVLAEREPSEAILNEARSVLMEARQPLRAAGLEKELAQVQASIATVDERLARHRARTVPPAKAAPQAAAQPKPAAQRQQAAAPAPPQHPKETAPPAPTDGPAAGRGTHAEVLEALLPRLLDSVDKLGKMGRQPGQVPRETIVALAQRLRPEDVWDEETAVRELLHVGGVAQRVLESKPDEPFLAELQRHVVRETALGQLEAAAQFIDAAWTTLQGWRKGVRRLLLALSGGDHHRRVEVLDASSLQGHLLRDPQRMARARVEIAALDHPDRPAYSPRFGEQMQAMLQAGEQKRLNLLLRVGSAMAGCRVESARTAEERGNAYMQVATPLLVLADRAPVEAVLKEAREALQHACEQFKTAGLHEQLALAETCLKAVQERLAQRQPGHSGPKAAPAAPAAPAATVPAPEPPPEPSPQAEPDVDHYFMGSAPAWPPQGQPEPGDKDDPFEAKVQRILADMQAQGLIGDGPKQVPEDCAPALLRAMTLEDLGDTARATREVTFAVSMAIGVIQRYFTDSPDLKLVGVMQAVARSTADGHLQRGADAIDEMLADLENSKDRFSDEGYRGRLRGLLEASWRQAELLRDVDRAVAASISLAAMSGAPHAVNSPALADHIESLNRIGRDKGYRFPLMVAVALGWLRVDAAQADSARGEALFRLGVAQATLGGLDGGAAQLAEAADVLEDACEALALAAAEESDSFVKRWGEASTHRGKVLAALGRLEDSLERRDGAVQAFRDVIDALEHFDDSKTEHMGEARLDLAGALWELSEHDADTELLAEAVQTYRAAREAFAKAGLIDKLDETESLIVAAEAVLAQFRGVQPDTMTAKGMSLPVPGLPGVRFVPRAIHSVDNTAPEQKPRAPAPAPTPTPPPQKAGNDDAFAARLQEILADFQARGYLDPDAAPLPRATVQALARTLQADERADAYRTTREITLAHQMATDVFAHGRRAADLGNAAVAGVLQRVAWLTAEGQFEQGASVIDDALATFDIPEEDIEPGYRVLLDAAVRQGYLLRDARRVADAMMALAALQDPDEPALSDFFQATLRRLVDRGRQQDITLLLKVAVELARRHVETAVIPPFKAQAFMQLAEALITLGDRERGVAPLHEALQLLNEAGERYATGPVGIERAVLTSWIGKALTSLGEIEDSAPRLKEAVQACREAVQHPSREVYDLPARLAAHQHALGGTLLALGERMDGTEHLHQAMQALQAAMNLYTQEDLGFEWASAQCQLGHALHTIALRKGDGKMFTEATKAYSSARDMFRTEHAPQEDARALGDLGHVTVAMGKLAGDRSVMARGIASIESAVQALPGELVHRHWATAMGQLGAARLALGELVADKALLESSVHAYREALAALPRGWPRQRAEIESGLASAEHALALIKSIK